MRRVQILLCILFLLVPLSVCAETEGRLLFIVNAKVDVKEISMRTLKYIFMGRKRYFLSGSPAKVAMFDKGSFQQTIFCRNFLGVIPHEINRRWDRIVYSGVGSGYKVVSDKEEMLQYIKDNDNAIGYFFSNELSEKQQEGIYVIPAE
ncbi:MAG: hypothetical protein D6B27_07905 [Gammaproteobacteria bacterium]|mgnify:CR=1 FL=1|nr:MAG: hypothetical protein D6B27_07905 [Gammaproteobacteria bacterium]